MKEELTGKLVEILTSIQAMAGKASDFAIDQLPDIAQSYVLYGRVSGSFSTAFFVIVSGFLAFGIKKTKKDFDNVPIVFGLALLLCFSTILSLLFIESTLLVFLAPKVWLLKELASLIK